MSTQPAPPEEVIEDGDEQEGRPRPARVPSSSRVPPPKGILKTHSTDGSDRPHLAWDEANLVLNEGQRDSTMKITEPKTPFVRYNPETDEVMNLDTIPGFELGQAEDVQSLRSPASSSGPSSRHSSFSASSRPSNSRRSSSSSSNEGKRVDIVLDENAQHGGIDPDLDDDELFAKMAPEERERHRKFSDKRKNHYGNEAEAMKRAQALMAQEDADESALIDDDDDDEPTQHGSNGVRVPPMPNGKTH